MANMKKISKMLTTGMSAVTLGFLYSKSVLAGSIDNITNGLDRTKDAAGDLEMNDVIKTIITTMLFIVGILAVIMIIYGGIRYVTAHGDKTQVASAKDTVVYAVVGLVVAIVAYALVDWVVNLFKAKGGKP